MLVVGETLTYNIGAIVKKQARTAHSVFLVFSHFISFSHNFLFPHSPLDLYILLYHIIV